MIHPSSNPDILRVFKSVLVRVLLRFWFNQGVSASRRFSPHSFGFEMMGTYRYCQFTSTGEEGVTSAASVFKICDIQKLRFFELRYRYGYFFCFFWMFSTMIFRQTRLDPLWNQTKVKV